jgi:voltage-gated potassium channel
MAMEKTANEERQAGAAQAYSNSYNIFILVLTVGSLAIMVLLALPFDEVTLTVLRFYDNLICVIFLIDFFGNLAASRPRRDYFISRRGWLDLIGSVPSFGFFPAAGLLRIARLSRLARITRLLRGDGRKKLIEDVVNNRGQYALFITILSALIVLSVSTVLIVQIESRSTDANITTGGDALWWGFVTITTVGYGDQYPVTALGRATAVIVMFAGVGIIGSLASILASVLVPQPSATDEPAPSATAEATVAGELANLRKELASQRATLDALREALTDERAKRAP